ncbi:MAG TPA: HAD family phosphatase [Bacteroidales bacterium]|nr:HAD family phosphatase [Bacteroidales bacterium]
MIRLVVTDLDGTLLRSDHKFNDEDMVSLYRLGEMGIIRAIATGRSPFSASTVLPADFPIDYLLFSSGAGIMRWSDKSIIQANQLSLEVVQYVIALLVEMHADFMVHEPIPLNHCFHYHSSGKLNSDFERRINLYKDYSQPLITGVPFPGPASQVLTVLPDDIERFNAISEKLKGVQVIRATSPLDGKSIWLEIFPEGVSKSGGIQWLCSFIGGLCPDNLLALGNDYNDIDMLTLAGEAFVVSNAPSELKNKFQVVPVNDEAGFSHAVKRVLKLVE